MKCKLGRMARAARPFAAPRLPAWVTAGAACAARPVRRTTVPSFTPASLPSSTTPTLSRDRFITMPVTPVSSSTSSPYTALSRP